MRAVKPLFAASFLWCLGCYAQNVDSNMGPLRGDYGFLTVFANITAAEARRRVDQMWNLSIREFEFYNAHGGYSNPPSLDERTWRLPRPLQETVVEREVVRAYTRYIAEKGGRSWLHVQMQATDIGDEVLQEGMAVLPPWKVDNISLLDLVVPNRTWGERIARRWANFSSLLGFQGIHWSTFGNWGDAREKGADYAGFLEASLEHLRRYDLGQTCGFIDGFGYDEGIFRRPLVAFNYWVRWVEPELPMGYWVMDAAKHPGVYCSWPGHSAQHTNEHWNRNHIGITAFDLIRTWWLKAREMNSTYLAIGDGYRHLQDDYYPSSVPLTGEQITILETDVTCYGCGELQVLGQEAPPTITTATITATATATITTATTTPLETTSRPETTSLPHPTTTVRTGECMVETRRGEMRVEPGTNQMMARLRAEEAALEERLRTRFRACRVSITDYALCSNAVCVDFELQMYREAFRRLAGGSPLLLARGQDPQSLPEAALRREKMVLQPRDGQRSESADMTEEVNDVISPMNCTVAIATVYEDRPEPTGTGTGTLPPVAIWAVAITLWLSCCFFCIFLLLIFPRPEPKPSDPPFCNNYECREPLTRPSGDEDFGFDNIAHNMNMPSGSARGPTFKAGVAPPSEGGSSGLR